MALRRNRVNNKADPAFTVAVAQEVADLLPTLTARITDEIRQNENNRNNVNRRNTRRVNTGGSGNDGDAQPTDIYVRLERFQKQKPQTFSSASTPVEAENWIAHIEKIFEVLGCDSYATDDDKLPTEKVSQELVDEMSQTVDEAKLHKVVNEMLRQRCTSGDEHQYHIDQMQNFLKNDVESQKEEVYSNSKIVQIIKTYWELGYEYKFITEIVARRANGSIVSIIESDYKNINKNDIEDMYLLIVHSKVDDYAETGLLWSLSVFIRITVIWERVHDFQLGVESYQQKVNLTAQQLLPRYEKLTDFF
ncbi:hypothetical protein Tco_0189024 [Tanacetum coccineum]